MSSATVLIHLSRSESFFLLTFKHKVKSFFLVIDDLISETFHMDLTFGIVLDRYTTTIDVSWLI